jgi:hypothetical protein
MTRMVSRDASTPVPYQYLVLRCVPRVDRQEFVNVGVVLYSQRLDFLSCATHLDRNRLRAFAPELDLDAVARTLDGIRSVCGGTPEAGLAGAGSLGERFGHLSAPRSTVVQPGPVHGGLLTANSRDAASVLEHLLATLVQSPLHSSEPSDRPSEPSRHSSEPSRHSSEPSDRPSEPSRQPSERPEAGSRSE